MAEWTKGPILALDLAQRTGWCLGIPGRRPTFGTVRLGSEGAIPEERGMAFCRWFDDIMSITGGLYAVCAETSMDPAVALRVGNGSAGLRFGLGLNYLACTYAMLKGVAIVRQVNVDDHRRHFLGRARFKGGSKEAKQACIARCKQLGLDVPDDNAADAVAIHDYACAIWAPQTAAQAAVNRMALGVRY